jgi:hypothetical protein
MDKQRKRQLRQQYKVQGFAEARRKMCLSADQLRQLHQYLDESLEGSGLLATTA